MLEHYKSSAVEVRPAALEFVSSEEGTVKVCDFVINTY